MLTEREQLKAMRELIANDAYAISFQSFGQYRAALLKHLDNLAALAAQEPLSQAVASQAGSALVTAARNLLATFDELDKFNELAAIESEVAALREALKGE